MKILRASLIVLLVVPSVALADRFVQYTDGRVGGCFQNENSNLYGCTPQPVRAKDKSRRSDMDILESRPSNRQSSREIQLEAENLALKQEALDRRQREQALHQENVKRTRALKAYFDAQDQARRSAAGRKSYENFEEHYGNCSGAEYDKKLKSAGLKKHPTVRGVCVPVGSSKGVAVNCPSC